MGDSTEEYVSRKLENLIAELREAYEIQAEQIADLRLSRRGLRVSEVTVIDTQIQDGLRVLADLATELAKYKSSVMIL